MSNYQLLGLSILTLYILYKVLWVKNFHNFIFWALAYQWTNVNAKIFYAPYIGLDFVSLHTYTDHILEAWAYSNVDLIAVAVGFKLISGKKVRFSDSDILFKIDLSKFTNYYITFSILTLTILNPWIYPQSLQQILLQFTYIKYALFFIGFSNILKHNDYKNALNYYFIFEFILSFSGYFSNFKDYLMIAFIVYVYVNNKHFKVKQYIIGLVIVLIGFNMGVIWSEIKIDYREFLTKGALTQASSRSSNESLTYLYNRLKIFNDVQYQDGLERFIDRLEYIDYFSACLGYVPSHKPHQNGKIITNAILYGFQPRFLFKDKEVLDDSKYTKEYTGASISGSEEATSICLGYTADGYIDFGKYFFFISPMILGLIIGFIYRRLIDKANNQLWGLAITVPLFFLTNGFGNALYKLIPPVMYFGIVSYVFLHFGLKYFKINQSAKKMSQ